RADTHKLQLTHNTMQRTGRSIDCPWACTPSLRHLQQFTVAGPLPIFKQALFLSFSFPLLPIFVRRPSANAPYCLACYHLDILVGAAAATAVQSLALTSLY
ncbi:hypothetical protein GOP47_0014084, partial [Adiantum capillus-veneris]